MLLNGATTRRRFVSALAAALSFGGVAPIGMRAQGRRQAASNRDKLTPEDYSKIVKIAANENPYGPSEAVMKAMNDAWPYANRYFYPDGGITGVSLPGEGASGTARRWTPAAPELFPSPCCSRSR